MTADTTPEPDGIVTHVPPAFDLRGRKQLWFVEGTGHDDLLNGMLTALVFLGPTIVILISA